MEERLDKYRLKRDPGQTNEPFSAERSIRSNEGSTQRGRFVIHQHAATRMHYDLRLEVGGVLESFAIPHGLSLDPKEKRLAIHTESHPLEYLHFEDVIPAGNYGAGSMIIWDTGGVRFMETSAEEGIERGKIDFVLSGFKVKGRFALIATGRRKAQSGLAGSSGFERQWLLIKKPDEHATEGLHPTTTLPASVVSGLSVHDLSRKSEIGATLLAQAQELTLVRCNTSQTSALIPMLCSTEEVPHRSRDYLYELKLDGVRILAEKSADTVRLNYRSGRTCTNNYADVARSLSHLPVKRALLDGEIVAFDTQGRPHFEGLGPRIRARRPFDVQSAESSVAVAYIVFDLLELGDVDLTGLAIEDRKKLLLQLIPQRGLVRPLDHIVERGDALYQMCQEQGLEGMIAKRLGSKYLPGPTISGHWIKIKQKEDAEFVVVGFTTQKDDSHVLGALVVASLVGERWVYRGRVGSGFSKSEATELLAHLLTLESESSLGQVEGLPPDPPVRLVEPEVVVRVRSLGLSDAGHLKGGVYLGQRADMSPAECTIAPNDEMTDAPVDDGKSPSQALEGRNRVKLSNLGKIFWQDEQITKGDLLDYYSGIAGALLPYLADRPVVLVRYPDGVAGKSFYQWRVPDGTPSWVRTIELYDEEKQKERGTGKSAFLIDDLDSLLHVVNLGCIPIHVLASRRDSRECCDFITIDFDLGERPFKEAVTLALSLKELLDELGLDGFAKTSGQRGLHVLIPLGPGVPFQSAKLLCELLGRVLVGRHPQVATMERRKEKRGDKLYVDTGQTGRSRTIVAPYSVRAFTAARVSTPLKWTELHLALNPSAFTIHSVVDRFAALGDPMAPLLESTPDLSQVLKTMAIWTNALNDRSK